MKPPKDPAGERFKTRYTCINHADAGDFSRALRQAFPNIRFLRAPYWEYSIFLGQRKDGCWRTKRIKNEPPNLHLPYVDTMGVEDGGDFLAWLEPEGWEPLWFGPNQNGIHFIANQPKIWFKIGVSHEYPNWGHPGTTALSEERIESRYYYADKEHLAFLNKVWRILEKLTSNTYIYHDRKTLAPKGPTHQYGTWSGHHARRWCLEKPNRYLRCNLRPMEAQPAD